jgi:hypothetical protein
MLKICRVDNRVISSSFFEFDLSNMDASQDLSFGFQFEPSDMFVNYFQRGTSSSMDAEQEIGSFKT